ncbi:carbohydrate ABC transporter permease [Streptomyces coeruleorubidus]|uniref:Sugar ABC transporter permease n=1 Tax=Streptomyces coeruleorubidus TaxID=116188 RepID=A0A5J6I280_STRC4|nr:sugar ABC transporter permease [Streptomyces coeruleorubidus]QEV23207.1 sugar ABC transporter permease [Streptomyces coeruleorubidus]GGT80437.1 sugar ABC transporter permease [Streptomyces coeruleorubidus]
MTTTTSVEPARERSSTRQRPQGSRGGSGRLRRTLVAWAFCSPFVLLFATFGFWPVLSSLSMSVTDITSKDVETPFSVNFVGLENYVTLFADPTFVRAALNTLYFVAVGIPLTMVISLAIAVALNSGIQRAKGFFRVAYFAPVVTSIVAIAVVWRYLYKPDGMINSALTLVGISGPDWLNDPNWSMPALILMAVWRHFGIPMVIFLAGLQSIPPELHEAAVVDGASRWRAFRSVTLPLLRPATLVVAVLLSISYLQFFEEPFVMTSGGPLDSTTSISYYAYEQFGFGNYGMASAASYVLVTAIALLSLLQFRIFRAKA